MLIGEEKCCLSAELYCRGEEKCCRMNNADKKNIYTKCLFRPIRFFKSISVPLNILVN